MQKRRNDVKARTTLLLALPDEHQLRFSKYETAKELWEAILKTFGGNEATKKTKKNQLKLQYGNFKAGGSKTLEQTFNRLQAIMSHLEFMDVEIKQDDLNQKFLTSLAPEWLMYWKKTGKKITIQGSDVISFDKSKVECFNYHKIGHFARECRAPRSQDKGKRESYKQGPKEENHALVVDDEVPTEFALMAKSSSSSDNKNASKDLDNLLGSQRSDKNKEGLEYSAVPPAPAQIYSPLKKDLSWTGLPEFVDDTVTDYHRPTPSVDASKCNKSELQSSNFSVFEHGKSTCSIISKPMIKFVKEADCPRVIKINNTENAKKSTMKYAEMYRNISKGPKENPQNNINDKGYWDSGCSRQMTGNISYLSEYEPYDGGYVSFVHEEMNEFCTKKGVRREFSNARTPQQNRVAERRNRTLIEAAKTMLADAKLPVTFWAEAVNTACYVQNRVIVNKSQNKTPYELFNSRIPAIGFLRPFGCQIMILNTLDQLVKFDAKGDEENKLIEKGAGPNWLFDIDTLTNSMNYVPVVVARTSSTNISEQDYNTNVPESSGISNPTATLKVPSADLVEPAISLIVESEILTEEPKKIFDALRDPSWVEAMQEELLQFKIQNVWVLVDCPKGVRPIGTKWVLKNKKDKRGIVIRNKARLVAQGYTQEERIDYEEVFAPVARIEAIRLFLAYASFMGFIVYQMDVKSAFLHGTIDEEIYVMQPPRFQDPDFPERVYKVEKAMYRLHQAARAWYVYVDDIIFGSSNPQLCREFEALMHDKFQMSAMGELTFFLSLQVLQKKDGIFLSQDKYGKDGPDKDVEIHLYRSTIGSLMYLTASRPDIMFAVCACAGHQVTPKECHLYAVKRIFRYLKGHPKLGLWYPKESPFDLVAYSDNDYSGATQDRKSITGEKTGHNTDFHQIVDFLKASHIRYDLTISPTIYDSHIRQFWSIARIETTDQETKIIAIVDGKPRTISESSLRRQLKLNDEEGISSLPDAELFENLSLMGYNILPSQSNIATAVVCLATNKALQFTGTGRRARSYVMQDSSFTQGRFTVYPLVVILLACSIPIGLAYAFHQDNASLVRVPVANVTLSSSAHLLHENTNSVLDDKLGYPLMIISKDEYLTQLVPRGLVLLPVVVV
nr:putative ribonuclease H-like domain-containing protein [Tanacetum cinerariifolium]